MEQPRVPERPRQAGQVPSERERRLASCLEKIRDDGMYMSMILVVELARAALQKENAGG